jgi:putative transposase
LYSTQTLSLSKEHPLYNTYLDYLVSARNLYNQCLYYCRNIFTGGYKLKNNKSLLENELSAIDFVNSNLDLVNENTPDRFKKIDKDNYVLSYYHLQKLLYKTNCESYFNNNLPAQSRNKLIDLACKNMKAFFKSIKKYSSNKQSLLGRPKLPNYRKENQWITFEIPNMSGKIKEIDGIYYFYCKSGDYISLGKTIHNGRLIKTSVSYEYGKIVLRLVFEEDDKDLLEDNGRYLGIDLGVDNFATISNNIGVRPIVIKGKVMKCKNQWFNKRKADLVSCYQVCQLQKKTGYITSKQLDSLSRNRDNYFRDVFHKISKYILNYALENNISKIVIGDNKGWKQNSNLNKINNQIFVFIPYQEFINTLIDKGKRYGIEVIQQEESYTSKSSILDLDILPTYKENDNTIYNFKGKRIKTKVYTSFENGNLHADVNGASNILRKHYNDCFNNQNLSYLQQKPIGIYCKSYI